MATSATGAGAVVLNVTANNPAVAGAFTVRGAGSPARPALNFGAASAATTIVTGLDTNGRVTINSTARAAVNFTVDVQGFYHTSTGDGQIYTAAASPARIADTQAGTGTCTPSCAALNTANPTLSVTIAGQGPVLVAVSSVVANITSIRDGTTGTVPAIAGYPADTLTYAGSPQNYARSASGTRTTSTETLELSPDGKVTIARLAGTGAANITVDILGWSNTTGAPPASESTAYTYTADGLRNTKTTTAGTTTYLWDRASSLPLLLAETTNGLTTRYLYGPGDLPIEQVNPDTSDWYFHHYQIGSTRMLTTAAGAVVGTTTYDPYGTPAATTGAR
ncbi:MAG: hypothetical protein ACT4PW_03370, partial [Acidimicrobiia bacterium]